MDGPCDCADCVGCLTDGVNWPDWLTDSLTEEPVCSCATSTATLRRWNLDSVVIWIQCFSLLLVLTHSSHPSPPSITITITTQINELLAAPSTDGAAPASATAAISRRLLVKAQSGLQEIMNSAAMVRSVSQPEGQPENNLIQLITSTHHIRMIPPHRCLYLYSTRSTRYLIQLLP